MRTQQQALCTQYTNNNVVAIEFSRRRKLEHSSSRTFITLQQSWFEDLRNIEPKTKRCCLQKGFKQRRISNKQLLLYTLCRLETVAYISSAYNKEFN